MSHMFLQFLVAYDGTVICCAFSFVHFVLYLMVSSCFSRFVLISVNVYGIIRCLLNPDDFLRCLMTSCDFQMCTYTCVYARTCMCMHGCACRFSCDLSEVFSGHIYSCVCVCVCLHARTRSCARTALRAYSLIWCFPGLFWTYLCLCVSVCVRFQDRYFEDLG